jgi:hypothetical protein
MPPLAKSKLAGSVVGAALPLASVLLGSYQPIARPFVVRHETKVVLAAALPEVEPGLLVLPHATRPSAAPAVAATVSSFVTTCLSSVLTRPV